MADLHFLANPARFRRFSQRVMPSLGFATILCMGFGLWLALVLSGSVSVETSVPPVFSTFQERSWIAPPIRS